MDILGIPIWLVILTLFMASVVAYTWHMSKDLNIFDRMRVAGLPPTPILGNLGYRYWKCGIFKYQQELYEMFRNHKVYGVFDANVPVLVVKDPDMIYDIMVTHFDSFVDRPNPYKGDPFMDRCVNYLCGDQWRKIRQIVNMALNFELFQTASLVMQRTGDALMAFLKPKIEWRRRVELFDLAFYYTMDVHSSIVFGSNHNTFERLDAISTTFTEKLLKRSRLWRLTSTFFPFMPTILRFFRVSVVPRRALKYCNKRMDDALQKAKRNGEIKRRQWITNLLEASTEVYGSGGHKKGAFMDSCVSGNRWKLDLHANGYTFITSGLDKISSILSFTLFLLANHPDCCKKVQDEIDDYIGAKTPDESNVERLYYMDQCIYETMRLYPQYIAIERVCSKTIDLHGIKIPADMKVRVPVYAIHHDPNIWSEPEEFRPQRFVEEQNSLRHLCNYLPFGVGPRNCLGERLALTELKMALVSILRTTTPFRCPKTVFPIKLHKWKLVAQGDLWVKFRPRFWSNY